MPTFALNDGFSGPLPSSSTQVRDVLMRTLWIRFRDAGDLCVCHLGIPFRLSRQISLPLSLYHNLRIWVSLNQKKLLSKQFMILMAPHVGQHAFLEQSDPSRVP